MKHTNDKKVFSIISAVICICSMIRGQRKEDVHYISPCQLDVWQDQSQMLRPWIGHIESLGRGNEICRGEVRWSGTYNRRALQLRMLQDEIECSL